MITLTAKIQAAAGKEQELETVLRELVKGYRNRRGLSGIQAAQALWILPVHFASL